MTDDYSSESEEDNLDPHESKRKKIFNLQPMKLNRKALGGMKFGLLSFPCCFVYASSCVVRTRKRLRSVLCWELWTFHQRSTRALGGGLVFVLPTAHKESKKGGFASCRGLVCPLSKKGARVARCRRFLCVVDVKKEKQ